MTHRLLITGGSGMIGRWLVVAGWPGPIDILARHPTRAAQQLDPFVSGQDVTILGGDARSFQIERDYSHLIHLAGRPCTPDYSPSHAQEWLDAVGQVWRQAERAGVGRALLVSTGAVVGPHPAPVGEDASTVPHADPARERYAESRRQAEREVAGSAVPTAVARIFTVIGPGMPADGPLAVGQFLGRGLRGLPLHLRRGRAVRSYLDHTDLTRWLREILNRGRAGRAYNVGSEVATTMEHLARLIGLRCGVPVSCDSDDIPEVMLPDTGRARSELGLTETVALADAIEATLQWHRGR